MTIKPVNAEIVNALVAPVVKALSTCADVQQTSAKLSLATFLPYAPCVTVTIELSGHVSGPIVCDFEPALAARVAAKMFEAGGAQVAPGFESVECRDAVSELANIIVGNATGALAEAGYEIEVSPPHARVRRDPDQLAEHTLDYTIETSAGRLTLLIGVNAR